MKTEVPEKWKEFYEGFERDLHENWINRKELEEYIDSRLEELERIIENSTRMGDRKPFSQGAYRELKRLKEILK